MDSALTSILTNELMIPSEKLLPEAGLEEVGIDSLGLVELSVVLAEQLGVELSEAELQAAATLGALNDLVAQTRAGR